MSYYQLLLAISSLASLLAVPIVIVWILREQNRYRSALQSFEASGSELTLNLARKNYERSIALLDASLNASREVLEDEISSVKERIEALNSAEETLTQAVELHRKSMESVWEAQRPGTGAWMNQRPGDGNLLVAIWGEDNIESLESLNGYVRELRDMEADLLRRIKQRVDKIGAS